MNNAIPAMPALTSPFASGNLTASKATEISSSFGAIASQMIDNVNRKQNEADKAIKQLHTGEADNIHDAMLALEEADISMRMFVQVRNKAVGAYEEIMRMQI